MTSYTSKELRDMYDSMSFDELRDLLTNYSRTGKQHWHASVDAETPDERLVNDACAKVYRELADELAAYLNERIESVKCN